MPAPLEILPKLLALACGGGPDGEVLAAVHKIQSLMVSNDWQWEQLLANGSATAFSQEQLQKVYTAGIERGEALGYQRGLADGQMTSGPRPPSIQMNDDVAWATKVLEAAAQAETDEQLDEFETDFSQSMRAKLTRFDRATYVSQKQFDALKRLEKSLSRRGYL